MVWWLIYTEEKRNVKKGRKRKNNIKDPKRKYIYIFVFVFFLSWHSQYFPSLGSPSLTVSSATLFDLRATTKVESHCVRLWVCERVWLVAMSSQMTSPGAMAVLALWLVIKVPSEQQDSVVAFILWKIYWIHDPMCGCVSFLWVLEQFKMRPDQQQATSWLHRHI